MRVNQKVTGRSMSMACGIGVGVLFSVVLTVIGSTILAALIDGEKLGENGIGYGAIVILLLASAMGAIAAWRCVRHRRLMVCLLTGVGYYGALLCVTALFFGGQYQGMGATALMVLAGCSSVGLLGLHGGKTGNRSYKKILSR